MQRGGEFLTAFVKVDRTRQLLERLLFLFMVVSLSLCGFGSFLLFPECGRN